MLAIGDKMPEFSLPVSGGGSVSNSDFAGKPWVLYFYPKDDTPGCTKEAIGFTEHLEAFAKSGATVLGVSKDSVAKHEKFIGKYDLKIRLASDEDSDFCETMGVWVEKNMYGKKYMGIERATYLIDASGNISEIWRKVKVPNHVETVLARLEEMT